MVFNIINALMALYVIVCTAWRIACLFRKKDSCSFTGCLFRKDYGSTSCIYFPDNCCNKCKPTDEELEVYRRSPDGIMDALKHAKKDE